MKRIRVIFKKEFIDTIRDRKALFFMIVFPILIFPLLVSTITTIQLRIIKKEQGKVLNLAYIDHASSYLLLEAFKGDSSITLRDDLNEENADSLIKLDSLDAAVVIGKEFDGNIHNLKTAVVHVHFRTEDNINISLNRIKSIINTYSESILSKRLNKMNLDNEIFEPIKINEIDLASEREKWGKRIGGFLPYFFILFCFMGAMYPAIDLGAGEKERGTLETLLVAPATRMEILLGKFGVITLAGILSAGISLLGIYISIKSIAQIPEDLSNIIFEILQLKTIILLITLLLPLTIFFAAILLMLSIYAKSFKEAQSIITPLNFAIIFPVFIGSMIPGIHLNNYTALIPILNIALASKEIVAGTVQLFPIFLVYLSSVIIAGLGLFACSIWFQRENVIFRD